MLSRSFKAPSSISNYISGVKTLHLLLELPVTAFEGYDLKLTIRGITRTKMHCPKQAKPITPKLLARIHDVLDHKNSVHATMWCLCLSSFYTLARKSNMVPSSPGKFDPTMQLCRSDVRVGSNGVIFTFKWTKTVQFGQRVLQIPVIAMPQSKLCVLNAFLNMVRLTPAARSDPAFLLPSASGLKPVSYPFFQKFIKTAISAIGLDPSGFSSHSFRRGGANLAFRSNVPSELIKVQGDWASQAYFRYLDFTLDQRLWVSTCMAESILNDM